MERSEKRKRDEVLDSDDEVGKKTKKIIESEKVEEGEVEEFYAILRRMHVAMKYFHDKRGKAEGWRTALEREVAEDAAPESAEDNTVLDLNSAPEDATEPPECLK